MIPLPRPLFWTVTGRDFGHSIAWARKQPNALREHIKAELIRRQGGGK